MNSFQRPRKVQEAIERTENELFSLFQSMKLDFDISKSALISLSIRGGGILPRTDDIELQEKELIHILSEFSLYERYPLFPSIEELSKCDTIVLFDDACETGITFNQYKDYLVILARQLGLHYSEEDIKFAAYIVKKGTEKAVHIDYSGVSLTKQEYEKKMVELYMVIASRGMIMDPTHMLIRAEFNNREDFFEIWNILEGIAESNYSDLVEDGIEFLHPRKKKLGFYIREDIRSNLQDKGLNFPSFITDIDIAKFRMVFNLELDERKGMRSVLTTGFEAVPIISPIIKKFSVHECTDSWCPSFRFCELDLISKEYCSHGYSPDLKYLSKHYYHPRYDCIIGNIVRQFKDLFLEEIKSNLGRCKIINEEWLHQERLMKQWRYFRDL